MEPSSLSTVITTFDAAVMLFSWIAVLVVVFGIGGLICDLLESK